MTRWCSWWMTSRPSLTASFTPAHPPSASSMVSLSTGNHTPDQLKIR
ncbi:hypothetical protein E2C01_099476 [Portunus trituberculatus]|uniref:Uncharacterized protein n=1 Tax=Portunus trituberculatus TaxID=210409 RepID=A0A5B7K0G4_PORTR|nr:hypothetical protein [Portunus trituberculatus]